MRKVLAGMLAVAPAAIFLQPALSLPSHPIQGHDAAEIASFCGAVGGTFGIWDSPGGGGVVYMCSWGSTTEAGSKRVACDAPNPGAKGTCVSNYDPMDPREPKLPAPKGKKGGGSKNVAQPSGNANTSLGSNTRNFGNTPPNAPANANVTGTTVSAGVTTATPATRGGVTNAPAKTSPNSATLGGGAFGGSMSPTMPGLAGVTGRKLP